MNILHIFDGHNYDLHWKRSYRKAVRAIIINGNKIALVKSVKDGYYKFPGGGIEKGEAHIDTLIRETAEETGLHIIPDSMREFGMLHEIRKCLKEEDVIFDQKSYYYYADVTSSSSAQNLDDYEYELGFTLEYADIYHAYQTNTELSKTKDIPFLLREAYILKILLEHR